MSFVEFRMEWDPEFAVEYQAALVEIQEPLVIGVAESVAETAIENAPVDTGSLISTIDVSIIGPAEASVNAGDTSGGGLGGGRFGKAPGYAVDYAESVEYSTATWGGKPYMTPAGEAGPGIVESIAPGVFGEVGL